VNAEGIHNKKERVRKEDERERMEIPWM